MYPVLLRFRPSTDFHISVSTDVPPETASEIGIRVRRALHHIAGVWNVSVQPSIEPGRWRVELRGPTGRHIWMFLGAHEALPAAVAEKFTTFIRAATDEYKRRVRAELASDREKRSIAPTSAGKRASNAHAQSV